jgi:hypothetical protein
MAVKIFKYHKKEVVYLAGCLFTIEEFNTFVKKIETILTCRPLLYSPPIFLNNSSILASVHFIISNSLTSSTEVHVLDATSNQLFLETFLETLA